MPGSPLLGPTIFVELSPPWNINAGVLQIEASEDIQSIGFAVDACQQSLQALSDCQLMVVHHDIFWQS